MLRRRGSLVDARRRKTSSSPFMRSPFARSLSTTKALERLLSRRGLNKKLNLTRDQPHRPPSLQLPASSSRHRGPSSLSSTFSLRRLRRAGNLSLLLPSFPPSSSRSGHGCSPLVYSIFNMQAEHFPLLYLPHPPPTPLLAVFTSSNGPPPLCPRPSPCLHSTVNTSPTGL